MVTATRPNRALYLRAPGFPDLSLDSQEFAALQGASGFGRPPVTARWFDGAGDGSVYRGMRVNRRVIPLPVLIQARDADGLQEGLSALAVRFAPEVGPARLVLDEGPGGAWYTDVVCTSGLDPVYGTDTDGGSWASVLLTLEAGDPYWTRVEPQSVPVTAAGAGRGLLKGDVSLSALRQASGQTTGTVTLANPGDAKAYPVVTITGPGTRAVLESQGLTLVWEGVLLAGQQRVLDHRRGTVVDPARVGDPDGGNRYNEMGPAPKFWPVPPGPTQARAELEGGQPGTLGPTGPVLVRNLHRDPRATTTTAGALWAFSNPTGGVSTQEVVTGATDGPRLPDGKACDSYRRATVTTGGTGSPGPYTEAAVAGAKGSVVVFGMAVRANRDMVATLHTRLYTGATYYSSNVRTVTLKAGEWTRLDSTVVAQDAYDRVRSWLVPSTGSGSGALTGDVYDWTAGMLPEGVAAPVAYVDGYMLDTLSGWYDWEGTPNASASTMRASTMVGRSSIVFDYQPRRWLVV